jgi:hypothetical protein
MPGIYGIETRKSDRMKKSRWIVVIGLSFFVIAGCHPPGSQEKQAKKELSGSAPPVEKNNHGSGTHSFVPYGDKPPLGTPVETH